MRYAIGFEPRKYSASYCKESIDNERMVHTEQTGMTMKGKPFFSHRMQKKPLVRPHFLNS